MECGGVSRSPLLSPGCGDPGPRSPGPGWGGDPQPQSPGPGLSSPHLQARLWLQPPDQQRLPAPRRHPELHHLRHAGAARLPARPPARPPASAGRRAPATSVREKPPQIHPPQPQIHPLPATARPSSPPSPPTDRDMRAGSGFILQYSLQGAAEGPGQVGNHPRHQTVQFPSP